MSRKTDEVDLYTRLHNFADAKVEFENIPKVGTCFWDAPGKFNIHNIIEENPVILNEGSFNYVYKIKLKSTGQPFVLRRMIKDKLTENDPEFKLSIDERKLVCKSHKYSLIMSRLVEQGIIPNFPLTIGSFFCEPMQYPFIIQEYANGDLFDFFEAGTRHAKNPDDCMNLFLQSIITYHFLADTLHVATYDAKPENVLFRNLEKGIHGTRTNDIVYEYRGKRCILPCKYLALVTDFDFSNDLEFGVSKRQFITLMNYKAKYNVEAKRYKIDDNIVDLMDVIYGRIIDERNFAKFDIFSFCLNFSKFVGIYDAVLLMQFMRRFFIKNENLYDIINDVYSRYVLDDVSSFDKYYTFLLNTENIADFMTKSTSEELDLAAVLAETVSNLNSFNEFPELEECIS